MNVFDLWSLKPKTQTEQPQSLSLPQSHYLTPMIHHAYTTAETETFTQSHLRRDEKKGGGERTI
jgi:hypothetical protein